MTTERRLPSEYLRQGWCQGEFAVDEDGNPVVPKSRKAVKRCLAGAGIAAFGLVKYSKFVGYIDDQHYFGFTSWQDAPERTADEVIAVAEEAERRMGLRDA